MKLSSSLHVLNSFQKSLPNRTANESRLLFFYPHITYGILLWGSPAKSHLNSVETMPKKAIRCIAGVSTYAHTGSLFSRHKLLKLGDTYINCILGNLYILKYTILVLLLACFITKKTMKSTHTIHVKLNKYIIYITIPASKLLAFCHLRPDDSIPNDIINSTTEVIL